MKKIACTVMGMLLCAGLISGCGTSLEAEHSVVYVDKKGEVVSLDVEEMDQEYYDETELETFVDEAVKEYTDANGKGSVKVDSLAVENGIAKLQMQYKTAEDYTKFNGIELYQGKIVEALAAGYIFEGDFARVEDGAVVGAANKQEIYAEEDMKVVIIKANTDVKIDGTICYVSCDNVALTGADSVSIREGYYIDNGSGTAGNVTVDEEAVSADATESATTDEEATGNEETAGTVAEQETVIDDGSFETEVYTFIVYK